MLEKIGKAVFESVREMAQVSHEDARASVVFSERSDQGDCASSIALKIAKNIGSGPLETAAKLRDRLLQSGIEDIQKIEVVAPGFLNFYLSQKYLIETMKAVLASPDSWGSMDEYDAAKKKTLVLEYFQLNIAKRPHIGHLRSAVIGDALKRMLLAQGYRVVSDTHVGDWGTQFGVLLTGYKDMIAKGEKVNEKDPFESLEKIYLDENARIEKDASRLERAKQEFAQLERGDQENRKIWQWMVDISMQKLAESAQRLNLLPFEEHRGESAYEGAMPAIVDLALQKGVAKKTSEGAVIVDLTSDGLDEAVLIKSDGASTYLLRDLATIKYRKEKWKFGKNLYVVDVRQSHHFQQVFRVVELLGFEGVGESEHIEFGFMTSKQGALSTRKGTAVSLDAVLDEAKERALKVIQEKNPDLKSKEEVAEAVGVGALKYYDLSHHRRSDIVFDWDSALSFEGNTGPYLQYTYARFKSILRKVGKSGGFIDSSVKIDDAERNLIAFLLRYPEIISISLKDFSPNVLASFLNQLAQKANEFYHSHPVAQEEDSTKKNFRIALVECVASTIAKGLGLLGVIALEEM